MVQVGEIDIDTKFTTTTQCDVWELEGPARHEGGQGHSSKSIVRAQHLVTRSPRHKCTSNTRPHMAWRIVPVVVDP